MLYKSVKNPKHLNALKVLKIQTLAAVPLFEHRKILHTLIGMVSAASVASVPYPDKATQISPQRTKKYYKKEKK